LKGEECEYGKEWRGGRGEKYEDVRSEIFVIIREEKKGREKTIKEKERGKEEKKIQSPHNNTLKKIKSFFT
jgi:hypothetical protein